MCVHHYMYACMYVCVSMCVYMRGYPHAKTQIRLQESHLCSAGGPTAQCSYPSSPLKYCRRPGEFCSSMGFPLLSTRLGTPLSLYPNTCAHVCCSELQCHSVLQCAAVSLSVYPNSCAHVCCNVLPCVVVSLCVAVCCSVLQCAAASLSVYPNICAHVCCSVTVCFSVLQRLCLYIPIFTCMCVARFCSVLQCFAVCCSVLQCLSLYSSTCVRVCLLSRVRVVCERESTNNIHTYIHVLRFTIPANKAWKGARERKQW